MPAEKTNKQVANGVAIDGSPEEDITTLPFGRDELGVDHVPIENVCVHDGHRSKLLAKLIALDDLAVLLVLGEIECDL